METIKIGFTGNRKGLTPIQEEEIILILDKYDNMIVSHGDCIGSDTDFHNLCMNYKNTHINKDITICIFPPNNPTSRAFNKGDLKKKFKHHKKFFYINSMSNR
jgi:hypothetical protein